MTRDRETHRTPKARRAFDILELARRYDISAAEAEGLYKTAGGDLTLARDLAERTKPSPAPPPGRTG